jgi:hypothetical protein
MARDDSAELVPPARPIVHKGKTPIDETGRLAKPEDPTPSPTPDGATLADCSVIGECAPCSYFETRTFPYCQDTGYKEHVLCTAPGGGNATAKATVSDTYRSCNLDYSRDSLSLFGFVVLNLFILLAASVVIRWRRRLLTGERVSWKNVLLSFFVRQE